ncbi:ABC-three component system middle component 1 [Chitinophaga sancti]|uniref:ABC-three component system middle component 1 n=1 Tax=Chitinophaga sancti TaxID=1004 RepID=UPI002A7486D1|nr:ABC-three component system middle component 1 [Chitinophaga sancti]WPQ66086.1 ABC-three component system middle component 1 [Chitinophaga sancti]
MDNIVNKIFEERNHERKEGSGFIIFSLKDHYNYWIVINRYELKSVLEEQINLFLEAKEIIGDAQFDKNANLLILNKVNSIDTVNKDHLLQIEEDLFHFKKNIIYYTEGELDKLKHVLDPSNIAASIESMLLQDIVFEQHKTRFDVNEYQSLLYRIAHKIPFLKINITQLNNLDSLEEINQKAIRESKLNDLLQNDFFSITDEELTTLTDDFILQKLKTTQS